MHIKVDEDLPRAIAEVLRQEGYSCSTVLEQEMGGWADADLWEAVQAHEQFLITADKGFGDIRHHAPGAHHGVLLLRPSEDGIRPLVALLEETLASVSNLEKLRGLLAVASPRGLRIKRRI